jgi:transcriptional regulator with XRE-family HTH domain
MTADRHPDPVIELFGARIRRERGARSWSTRELCARAGGMSTATVNRVEHAKGDIWLSIAAHLAVALDLPLGVLGAAPACAQCYDHPPDGYNCRACGRPGNDPP